MSQSQGTYSFLPWLRQGLANQIQAADFDPAVQVRANIAVQLELRGDKLGGGEQTAPLARNVALYGPGDIVGIERRAFVRMEPRHWITNFEPNYLAHIEFYDEDMPWRYTPAAPDLANGRLRPWIALIVLEEAEFKDGQNTKDKPLPYIDVNNLSVFPKADELWAWAHVHVNRSLAANDGDFLSTDMNSVLPKFQGVLNENPDLAYSRILSPRKLAENKAYHAFLVPAFETGRRAGLNIDLGNIPATMSAWDGGGGRPQALSFPYYHRWFFRTGSAGDFETLVRLLVPRPVDRRVGTREMDLQYPGSNVPGIDKPALRGYLKLGGALRPPTPVPAPPPDPWEVWDDPFPRPLQTELARLVDLADDYLAAGDPDPIITPPLYGTWHAMVKRVLKERDNTPVVPANNWIHRLNLDPRFRAAAGIGTRVIQDNQERYMNAAWEQIGDVLEMQRRTRQGRLSLMVSDIWYDRHLQPILGVSRQKTLLLMAPLNKRVLLEGTTLHYQLNQSLLQPAMTSSALRRIIRPRGRLIRTLPFDAAKKPDALLARVGNGEVSAAPPKLAPPGVLTNDQAAGLTTPANVPAWVVALLRRFPKLPTLVLIAAILIAVLLLVFLPLAVAGVVAAVVVGAGIYISRKLKEWRDSLDASDILTEANETPAAVDAMPGIADFHIAALDSGFVPSRGGVDSVEAARFKGALRNTFALLQASATVGSVVPRKKIDIAPVATGALATIDPSLTIPRRIRAGIFVPPRISDGIAVKPGEAFVEPMAYPIIDEPMYEPLKNKSDELFLPNINLIEANTITLLETNQRFIESYMVGLNHEFARELLWREYPTDQRGSTFRQFWDVRGVFNATNAKDEDLKESLRDIPPLHLWGNNTALGEHNNREVPGKSDPELVLVIRGELLKRYPTAVIYAHRACWQRKDVAPGDKNLDPCNRSGAIDNTQERRLAPLTPDEEASPPRTKVLTPLYEAKVDPDLYFFGFDLTVAQAKGGTGEHPDDDPGWFFVIKERPGEPRFGLDTEASNPRNVWNDLSWPDVCPGAPGTNIDIAATPATLALATPGAAEEEKLVQYADDKKIVWSHNMSSAQIAYIFWQAPVLVGVHASEMLPK
jgi:hypothetical protein